MAFTKDCCCFFSGQDNEDGINGNIEKKIVEKEGNIDKGTAVDKEGNVAKPDKMVEKDGNQWGVKSKNPAVGKTKKNSFFLRRGRGRG